VTQVKNEEFIYLKKLDGAIPCGQNLSPISIDKADK